jgi:hypothetical protein
MSGGQVVSWLACVIVFGIFVPWYKGLDFFDPLLLILYFCLSGLFVAPVVSDLVSTDPKHASRGIVRGFVAGWCSGLLIVTLGLTTLSIVARKVMLPPVSFLIGAVALSLACSILAAALAAMIALLAGSAETARRILRSGFFALLLGLLVVPRVFPGTWSSIRNPIATGETRVLWYVSLLFVGAAIGVLVLIRRRLRDRSGR